MGESRISTERYQAEFVSGPLEDDDGLTPTGPHFEIMDTASRPPRVIAKAVGYENARTVVGALNEMVRQMARATQ